MYERKIPVLNCGLDLAGELLYGKWKMRLLYFIHAGHHRPSELQRKIPDASPRVLLLQLKELEEHQLIVKTVFAQVPPKVEYHLTAMGQSLIPVIDTLGQWGDQYKEALTKILLKTHC